MQERIGKYLSHSFLCILSNYLKGRKKFVTARGFDDPDMRDKAFMCYSTNDSCLPIDVKSDHEETDRIAWLHALDGSLINILIYPLTLIHTILACHFWESIQTKWLLYSFQMLLTRKSIFI